MREAVQLSVSLAAARYSGNTERRAGEEGPRTARRPALRTLQLAEVTSEDASPLGSVGSASAGFAFAASG